MGMRRGGLFLDQATAAAAAAAATHAAEAAARARAVYGERFADKAKRVQAQSPHGRRPGWAVRPVIVKSGDDCRQVRSLRSPHRPCAL